MEFLAELAGPLIDSFLIGSFYALMGAGLTMVFAVTKVPDFAHAELVTIGGYAAAFASVSLGLGMLPTLVFAMLVAGIVSLGYDETVFKPLWKKGASSLYLLVASVGLGLFVRYVLMSVVEPFGWLSARANISPHVLTYIGYGSLTDLHVIVIVTTVLSVAVLHLMFTRTKLGKAMRATASNPELARISGINITLVRRITWLIGGVLAGMAGGFWSMMSPIDVELGWRFLLWMFAAAIVGGFSFYGTILGGYIIGLAEGIGIFLLNMYFGVEVAYKPVISLVIMVLVLLFAPQGLRGISLEGIKQRLGLSSGFTAAPPRTAMTRFEAEV